MGSPRRATSPQVHLPRQSLRALLYAGLSPGTVRWGFRFRGARVRREGSSGEAPMDVAAPDEVDHQYAISDAISVTPLDEAAPDDEKEMYGEAAAGEAAAGEAAPALPAVPALDAYSFGITAFQVIERREPYQHLNLAPGCPDSLSRLDFGHAVAARGLRPAWDPHLEIEEGAAALAEARELVELCWAPEPAERPPMARLAEALRTASTLAMYKYF